MKDEQFEDKISKINEILEHLNDKNLTLSDSVKFYKNGINLLREARDILNSAKLEIEEFNEQENG